MMYNIFNTVQVTRQTPPTDSAILAEQYQDLGLPFYYYSLPIPNFSFLLVLLGVVIFAAQIICFLGGILFVLQRKRYKCLKCKKVFYQRKPPKKCEYCGGEVVLD